jgi:hypothetical protein
MTDTQIREAEAQAQDWMKKAKKGLAVRLLNREARNPGTRSLVICA